jgi:hypothetical protein
MQAAQRFAPDHSFQLAQLGDCEEIDEALETVTERLETEIKTLGKCIERSDGKKTCEAELQQVQNDGVTFKSYVNRRHPDCK